MRDGTTTGSERNIKVITWVDAGGVDGWHEPLEPRDYYPRTIVSVGYVSAENENCIVLTNTVDVEGGHHHADLVIPIRAIRAVSFVLGQLTPGGGRLACDQAAEAAKEGEA